MRNISGLEKLIKGRVRYEEPLKAYTTFRIGGPCHALIEPDGLDNLKKTVEFLSGEAIDFFVIGAGSNLLVSDTGTQKPALTLRHLKEISVEGDRVCVQSGLKVKDLLAICVRNGLSGIEFLSGIPGTVGGALAMNAGGSFAFIGEFVEEITILDMTGTLRNIAKDMAGFRYRSSDLKGVVIVGASFRLYQSNSSEVEKRIRENLEIKRRTQDLSHPSAGSVFKNPDGMKAWRLIDSCGLKGKRIGDAAVSEKHANFIINLGDATSKDVLQLIEEIEERVEKDYGIRLEREIEVIE